MEHIKRRWIVFDLIKSLVNNFLLVIVIYIVYFLRIGLKLDIRNIIILSALYIGYLTVYYINDYADSTEDKSIGKRNLYNEMKNKVIYGLSAAFFLFYGLTVSHMVSNIAFLVYIALITINLIYSINPFRFKKISFVRNFALSLIYFLKIFLISVLLEVELTAIPYALFFMISALSSFLLSVYKRRVHHSVKEELYFGVLFVLLYTLAVLTYKVLILYLIPLLPIVVILYLIYRKTTKAPIGICFYPYACYVVAIFVMTSIYHII